MLNEIGNLDYAAISDRISGSIAAGVKAAGARGVAFGLSGGIDSAVVAYLCRHARYESVALLMPDCSVTPESETTDAVRVATLAGLKYVITDIGPIMDQYAARLEPNARALGNLRARVRADILYHHANAKNYLVLGTSDRSEYSLGYFTKFGDGACDMMPIASLYKLQVRGLARHLGIPDDIIGKQSSPHLWHGHTAEGELGMGYEEADLILHCLLDCGMSLEAAAQAAGLPAGTVRRVMSMSAASEHKRRPPGVL